MWPLLPSLFAFSLSFSLWFICILQLFPWLLRLIQSFLRNPAHSANSSQFAEFNSTFNWILRRLWIKWIPHPVLPLGILTLQIFHTSSSLFSFSGQFSICFLFGKIWWEAEWESHKHLWRLGHESRCRTTWCSYCPLIFVFGGFHTIFSDGMADLANNGNVKPVSSAKLSSLFLLTCFSIIDLFRSPKNHEIWCP